MGDWNFPLATLLCTAGISGQLTNVGFQLLLHLFEQKWTRNDQELGAGLN